MSALRPKDCNLKLEAKPSPRRPKQMVSTSGIFKAHPKAGCSKNPLFNPFKAACKRKTPKKVDPLVEDVNNALSATSHHLRSHTASLLDSTHSALLARLASATASASAHASTRSAIARTLAALPSDELLRFIGRSGEDLGSARLAQRVAVFARRVRGAEKELGRLWGQWEAVERETEECVRGLGEIIAGMRAAEGELARGWLERVDARAEEAVERMRESEKELKVRTKRQRDDFLKVLQARL